MMCSAHSEPDATSLLRRKSGAIVQKEVKQVMNKYEAMYIINPTLDEESTKAIIEKFKGIVEANGVPEALEEWGRKRLAYEVQDQKEGYYVLMHFEAPADFPAELERNFKITEGVMKYLVTRKDA